MEELEAALVKQLQTDTAVEKLEEQRKMFMSKLEELETALSQKHNEVRQMSSCLLQLFTNGRCLHVNLVFSSKEDVIELQDQGKRSVVVLTAA